MDYKEQFIEDIASYVLKYAPQFNIKCPSAVIAQACKESGFGKAKSIWGICKADYHNYFGLKYREGRVTCHNGTFFDGSKEQRPDASYYDISDSWYSFENMEMGVLGYFQWTNVARYAALKGVSDPLSYLTILANAKYFTSLTYVESAMNDYITPYNLTRFDEMLENSSVEVVKKPNIVMQTSTKKTSVKNARSIEYIVIHYTAGTTSKPGAASNTASYFANSPKDASADFIVDDATVVQYNPDILNRYAWHCGGSKYDTKGGSLLWNNKEC